MLIRFERFVASRPAGSRWAAAAIWHGVIFSLSQVPGANSGSTADLLSLLGLRDLNALFRLLAHMAVFGVQCVLLYAAIEGSFRFSIRGFWVAMVLNAALALSDEIHQYFVPLRTCRLQDFLTDVAGGGLALGIIVATFAVFVGPKESKGAPQRGETPNRERVKGG